MSCSMRSRGGFGLLWCLAFLAAASLNVAEPGEAEPAGPKKETRSDLAKDADGEALKSFLFVDRGALGSPDRYLSVGTVIGRDILVNKLMRVSRGGYYSVVAQPNEYDLWIWNEFDQTLLCIDCASPLVSEIVGNAERLLRVTEEGLYFASERPRNSRRIGAPCLYYLDFGTHEVRSLVTPRKLDGFYWRTAVISPDGAKLASISGRD